MEIWWFFRDNSNNQEIRIWYTCINHESLLWLYHLLLFFHLVFVDLLTCLCFAGCLGGKNLKLIQSGDIPKMLIMRLFLFSSVLRINAMMLIQDQRNTFSLTNVLNVLCVTGMQYTHRNVYNWGKKKFS